MDIAINETLGYVLRKEKIFNLITIKKISRFLDIGCGVGHFMHELLDKNLRGDGMDISAESLTIASQVLVHHKDVHFYTSLDEIPWSLYSHVFMLEVMEHIKNDAELLAHLKERISRETLLIISVPANQSYYGHHDVLSGHYRRYDYDTLKKLICDAGFAVKKIAGYGPYILPFREPYLHWKAKNKLLKKNEPAFTEGSSCSGLYLLNRERFLLDKIMLNSLITRLVAFPFTMLPDTITAKKYCLGYVVIASS